LTNYCQEVFRPRLKFPGWAMPTLIFSRVGACPPCSPRAGAHGLQRFVYIRCHTTVSVLIFRQWSFLHSMFTQTVRRALLAASTPTVQQFKRSCMVTHMNWQIFGRRQYPWPQSNWVQNLWHNSVTSLPDKSAGSGRFDAASDRCL